MDFKKACISRYGMEEGIDTFNQIIEDCSNALEYGHGFDAEEILHEAGFEPDYLMDVIDILL